MLSTSFEYRRSFADNSKALFKATLEFADGTVGELGGDDVIMGTARFSDAVSSDGSFDIGAAIINQFEVTLNNYDQRFDECDFTGSTIVPYVGVELPDGKVEWLRKGCYGIDQPRSYGSTISLTALDNMRWLERPYSDIATVYPASLQVIVQDICTGCGVTLTRSDFANSGYVVAARPDDSALACLDMVSYAAQVSGNYARCNADGHLEIDWYDTSAFEGEDWLDGDRFDDDSPYSSGDSADGGNFTNYGNGAAIDGGAFGSGAYAHIFAISSASICTDDVVITGVRVTAQGETAEDGSVGRDGETALHGSEGYVLSVEGNPLVAYGAAAKVAQMVGARVVGMRFRPLDISAIGNPAIEAGDPIVVTDRLQNQYRAYATSLTYTMGDYESFSCSAETPSRNTATSYSAMTKADVWARKLAKLEKTAREQALASLQNSLDHSSGLYETVEPQQDGSNIYYMHDKPTLAESQIIWKLTVDAVGISIDGGESWPYGVNVSGDAILNRIYALGIDADYLTVGRISDKAGKNFWDLVTGDFQLSGTSTINGKSASALTQLADNAISSVDVEYAQNQSTSTAPTSGWDTSAPEWKKGHYVWQRTKTVNSGGVTYSEPTCINGADGEDGVGIKSTTVTYGTSSSVTTQPTSWSPNVPSVAKGQWLWVKTAYTYTDGGEKTVYTKSYVGTDGTDGKSVYVKSTGKSNGVTTVVLTDGATDTTMTIEDGTDGKNGLPGANGYVHVAWATSADGSQGFSTSVSANKTYIGVYTDNTQADSTSYRDYSWSLIKGADGEDGVGIKSIAEQYYLSSSNSTQAGGSWQASQPEWAEGKHIWTRSVITWDTNPETTTTTAPVLAQALTQANQQAKAANTAIADISTQEAIFNLLTSNGTLEGLYMRDGKLYINASYILSGTLKVGGANNANGILQVLDASGKVISQLDKDGADITGQLTLKSSHKLSDVSTKLATLITENGLVSTVDSDIYYWLTGGTAASDTRYMQGLKIQLLDSAGKEVSHIIIIPSTSADNYHWSTIAASGSLYLLSNYEKDAKSALYLSTSRATLEYIDSGINVASSVTVDKNSATIAGATTTVGTSSGTVRINGTASAGDFTATTLTGSGYVYLGSASGSTNYVRIKSNTLCDKNITVTGKVTVSGTKSRLVETEHYSDRLLYCYETPTPLFGDLGSGVIGEDGLCFVEIDDIFSETTNTAIAYQVFLQKCGQGDIWVAEKHGNHFIVEGTPGLAFDWELKCRQAGYETTRIEQHGLEEKLSDTSGLLNPEEAYQDYIARMECVYEEEKTA